jgi:hypothetical protein
MAIQLEMGWLPSLTATQEQVGFAGTAGEDLNKAPFFVRPRFRTAVSRRLAITIAGVPPVRFFGVTPRLLALGADWTLMDRRAWRIALRGHGQIGSVTGAFTCPSTVLAFAPGSEGNPTGCRASSSDAATLRYVSVEADASHGLTAARGLTPHIAVAFNRMSGRFQVDARTFDQLDRTRLEMSGNTWSITGGASVPVARRFTVSADLLYAPLAVRRNFASTSANDALLTARATITYWIRQ